MKKFLLGIFSLSLLLFSACKKSDSNGTPSNTITINGTSYSMISTSGFNTAGGGITIAALNGVTGASLVFTFTTLPTANGSYTVIANNSTTQTSSQVSFSCAAGSNVYESTGAGSVNVTVTVNSGKLTISMPDAPASQTLGGSSTVNVNCNVTQP